MPLPTLDDLLRQTGVHQAQLARLTGRTPGAVNRWFSITRRDALPPPAYALSLLMALRTIEPDAREVLIRRLERELARGS